MRIRRIIERALLSGFVAVLPAIAYSAQPPAQADSPRFRIDRFVLTGSTLLPAEESQQLLAPYTGTEKDFTDVQRAFETIKDAYNRRGYGVVQVVLPEQDISQGVIEIRVVEARLNKIEVIGNKNFSEQNIRASLPSLVAGSVPRSTDVARNLQLLADNPAKQTSVVFKPGTGADSVDAEVKVNDERPWRIYTTADNTGTGETGYTRVGVGFRHSNMFGRDHELNLRYITSLERPSDVTVIGAGYYVPVYSMAGAFNFTAGYSDVSSGTLPNLFNVSGKGAVYGVRYTQHLTPRSPYEHKLIASLDYRAYQNDVTFGGAGFVPDITVHPVVLGYQGTWRWAATMVSFHGSYARNISGGNDGDDASFKLSRANARAAYRFLRYGLSASHSPDGHWIGNFSITGQTTRDALIAGEQIGLGGPDSLRGLKPREVANDRGYYGTIEVLTPDLTRGVGRGEHGTRLAAFIDWGSLSRNHVQPGESSGESAAAAGLGLRYLWRKNLSVRWDVAHLINGIASRSSSGWRSHVSFAASF